MKPAPDFSLLCQTFFAKRLIDQHKASPHTIAAYAQTFRLLQDSGLVECRRGRGNGAGHRGLPLASGG